MPRPLSGEILHPADPQPAPPHPHAARLARLDRLARLMDARFRLPGTGFRFGWDSVLGLAPGIGDLATALPAIWILLEAARAGLRRRVLARMALNIAIDAGLGAVPLVGDLFDAGFKANLRNIALLRRELGV